MLARNGALTSLSLGDPLTLSDPEASEGATRILQHAGASLKRLSFAYVPFPSLPAAQSFCNALEGNTGARLRKHLRPCPALSSPACGLLRTVRYDSNTLYSGLLEV